jgi:hypothetical protein
VEHALKTTEAVAPGAALTQDHQDLVAPPAAAAPAPPGQALSTPSNTPSSPPSAWRSRLVLTAACAATAPIAKAGLPIAGELLECPTPELIRSLRVEAGWSQLQAAQAVGCSHAIRWCEYESGASKLAAAKFELFLLKIGRHPLAVLRRRQGPARSAAEGV